MEPLFFKAENGHIPGVLSGAELASMEPLFFKAENKSYCRSFWRAVTGFNGAAFFQSGKCAA